VLKIVAAAGVLGVAVVTALLLIAYQTWSDAISEDIARITSSPAASAFVVTEEALENLPAPVQRYLRYSNVVGKPIPSRVRLAQRGRIRSNESLAWMPFEADEHYAISPPAFIWRASFPRREWPIVLGRDEYIAGRGSIVMKLLSVYAIAEETGAAMNPASLMRYLNEMTWFPAAFVGPNITWHAIDDSSAEVTIDDRGMTAKATMIFDAEGRPLNFRARRYHTSSRQLQLWETPFTKWGQLAGVNVPLSGKAIWRLPTGLVEYIELEVASLEYE
jgi:hypothetical protein